MLFTVVSSLSRGKCTKASSGVTKERRDVRRKGGRARMEKAEKVYLQDCNISADAPSASGRPRGSSNFLRIRARGHAPSPFLPSLHRFSIRSPSLSSPLLSPSRNPSLGYASGFFRSRGTTRRNPFEAEVGGRKVCFLVIA